MNSFAQKIDELVSVGCNVKDNDSYLKWSNRVTSFLAAAINTQAAAALKCLGGSGSYWKWTEYRDGQIAHLDGIALRIEASGLQRAKILK